MGKIQKEHECKEGKNKTRLQSMNLLSGQKYIRNQIKSNELRPQLAYVPQTTIS